MWKADTINEIKDINGFIYVYKDSAHHTPNVLISNLSLFKYHQSEEKATSDTDDQPKKESKETIKPKEERKTRKEPQKLERITTAPSRR